MATVIFSSLSSTGRGIHRLASPCQAIWTVAIIEGRYSEQYVAFEGNGGTTDNHTGGGQPPSTLYR
jgi:hypothetical protein